jgi:hypothetical protein
MRKEAAQLGYKVPCDTCKTRNNCCKNINSCELFFKFNCGDLHPTQRVKTPVEVRDEDENQNGENSGDGAA